MNILIINGHPREDSFSSDLTKAYSSGAEQSGAKVTHLALRNLKFDFNLKDAYGKSLCLEPDLLDAQAKLEWADHLVWVFPILSGAYPVLLKVFLDRVLSANFDLNFIKDSKKWQQYFKDKSVLFLSTFGQASSNDHLIYKSPRYGALSTFTRKFIGNKKVRSISFGNIRFSTGEKRKKWILKVNKLGINLK